MKAWTPALCGHFLRLGPWPQLLLVASGSGVHIRRSDNHSTPAATERQTHEHTDLLKLAEIDTERSLLGKADILYESPGLSDRSDTPPRDTPQMDENIVKLICEAMFVRQLTVDQVRDLCLSLKGLDDS